MRKFGVYQYIIGDTTYGQSETDFELNLNSDSLDINLEDDYSL